MESAFRRPEKLPSLTGAPGLEDSSCLGWSEVGSVKRFIRGDDIPPIFSLSIFSIDAEEFDPRVVVLQDGRVVGSAHRHAVGADLAEADAVAPSLAGEQ